VARDRKRAKQRRERRGAAVAGRERQDARRESNQPIERADVPGALDHASGDVDEFDAALVRGADGVAATPEVTPEPEAEDELDLTDDALQVPGAPAGGGDGGGPGGGAVATGERPSGAPLRGGNRVIGFLRASWAELQRVQWPDAGRSPRPRPSCSASSSSPAPISAPLTSSQRKSSNSSWARGLVRGASPTVFIRH